MPRIKRTKPSDLKKTAHAVYRTKYHIVWIPKYRKKLLNRSIQERLKTILFGIAERYDLEIDTLSVQEDYIHLFVSFPPHISISQATQIFKGVSSNQIRQEFSVIDQQLWGAELWAPGYYVSTVND